MRSINISDYLIQAIAQLLLVRNLFVRSPHLANSHGLQIPQGSLLSLLFFNIYSITLNTYLIDKIKTLQFADDTVLCMYMYISESVCVWFKSYRESLRVRTLILSPPTLDELFLILQKNEIFFENQMIKNFIRP